MPHFVAIWRELAAIGRRVAYLSVLIAASMSIGAAPSWASDEPLATAPVPPPLTVPAVPPGARAAAPHRATPSPAAVAAPTKPATQATGATRSKHREHKSARAERGRHAAPDTAAQRKARDQRRERRHQVASRSPAPPPRHMLPRYYPGEVVPGPDSGPDAGPDSGPDSGVPPFAPPWYDRGRPLAGAPYPWARGRARPW